MVGRRSLITRIYTSQGSWRFEGMRQCVGHAVEYAVMDGSTEAHFSRCLFDPAGMAMVVRILVECDLTVESSASVDVIAVSEEKTPHVEFSRSAKRADQTSLHPGLGFSQQINGRCLVRSRR